MGEVELPYVAADTTIESALDVMQRHGRSGIVTSRDGQHIVLTDDDLVRSLRERGDTQVCEVKPTRRATLGFPEKPRYRAVFAAARLPAALHRLFSSEDVHFALEAIPGTKFLVRTVEESVVFSLGRPTVVCRCQTNPQRHVWRPAELINPGRCNNNDGAVDCSG